MRLGKRTKAKKYADLRKLQATANKYLKQARVTLGKEHGKYKNAMSRLKQFYKSRGIKYRGYASMYDLTKNDIKAYEQMLKSIVENTYINPTKYQNLLDADHARFIEEGGAEGDYNQWLENFKTIDESDILQDLMNIAFKPSEINDMLTEYENDGLTEDDFIEMVTDFLEGYKTEDYTIDDFLSYMDEWKTNKLNEDEDKDEGDANV